MRDWTKPEVLAEWRLEWEMSTTKERRADLADGDVPGFVLVHLELVGPMRDADLIGLAHPELEARVERAFRRAQALLVLHHISVASSEEATAAELAVFHARRLEIRRAVTNRWLSDLRAVTTK